MNTEVITDERGRPRGRIEANIAAALQQGRIAAMEVPHWRKSFAEHYERAMSQILARPVSNLNARVVASPQVMFSEAQYDAYAVATGVRHPHWNRGGLIRSVV